MATAQQIKNAYLDYVLTHHEKPKSVYSFVKKLKIPESAFYEFYASFESIEKMIWFDLTTETIDTLSSQEIWTDYSSRDKVLSFFYSYMEVLKKQRSFILYCLKHHPPGLSAPAALSGAKSIFENFAENIIQQGLENGELADRKFLTKKYKDALWIQFIFILNFWANDDSTGFEKTDEAIEKGINVTFDLFQKSPLDNLFEYGKFLSRNGNLREKMSKTERSAKFVKTGIQIGGNYIKHYSKKLFNPQLDKEELNQDNAVDIYKSLSELKGSALKVAQMLSMDKNILPKSYIDQFTQSQYNAPPLSGPLIVRTFTKNFGKSPEQIYNKFNLISTNAASIGQVHQAELNGKKLAVKIQYPGVGDSISSDLKLIKPFAFRLLGMKERELNVYIKEVEERLLEETDYELEVKRSIEFSKACNLLKNVVFPTYYPALSGKKIITMDWIEGLHLPEFLKTNPTPELRNKIGQALWDFYNFQQHQLRAVHADPHPGNFLITPDEKLGVIDFGCIKEMPDDFYRPFFSLISTGVMEDKAATIDAFRQLDMIHPTDTESQVEFYYKAYREMISLFARPYRSKTFDFSQPDFFEQLYGYGEKISKMPEFKQARGVKHFIYINRTNFGLYTILQELKAVTPEIEKGFNSLDIFLQRLSISIHAELYKNILVIEDNHAILDVITLILQSEAYKVSGLSKSADMLEHIEAFKPDLIILDIMLPDADGRVLLKELRSLEKTKDIPVLMISARYTQQNIQHGEHKPNGFLAKPFDIDDLLDRIEGILAGQHYD
eukprot:gene11266-13801_t